MKRFIYIIISKTPTKFGKAIRKLAKQQYNHASIALDEDLTKIYAFARTHHNAVLLGGLVRESLDRFTLRRDAEVPVMLFRIPVTEAQYIEIKKIILEMLNNKKYIYNMLSVLTYPITKGFTVKNAFTCIEFVVYILQYLGYLTEKPACKYKPDDLIKMLNQCVYKVGDIREFTSYNPENNAYFNGPKLTLIPKSIASVYRIIKHTFEKNAYVSNLLTFHII